MGQPQDVCVSEEDQTSTGQVWDGRNGEKPVPASSDAKIAFSKHRFATHTALQHLKTTSVNYWWAPQKTKKNQTSFIRKTRGFFFSFLMSPEMVFECKVCPSGRLVMQSISFGQHGVV